MKPTDIAIDVSTIKGTGSVNASYCQSGNGTDIWTYD